MRERHQALDIGPEFAQRCAMQTVPYTQAKRNLNAVMDKVVIDRAPILITQRSGPNVVMISAEEWAGMEKRIWPATADRYHSITTVL